MGTQGTKFSGYKQAVYVALITFLVGACYGALSPLMPITMQALNCSSSEVGMPSTVETIACFIAGLYAGKFIIKFQAKRCVLACAIISAASVAVYAYAPSLMVICIYEAFLGVFMAAAMRGADRSRVPGRERQEIRWATNTAARTCWGPWAFP